MTGIAPLQLRTDSLSFSEQTKEILSLPSVLWPGGSPRAVQPDSYLANSQLLPETDEVTPFKRLLLGRVDQFSSAALRWQKSGAEMRAKSETSLKQLQQLSEHAHERERKNGSLLQLEDSVSKSTLSKFTSFAKRRAELENRKSMMARCVQMEDASLSLSIAAITKDLDSEEKKEVLEVANKAPIGALVNHLAAVPAAISTGVRGAFKTVYLGAVGNHCLETDPSNFKRCVFQLRHNLEGQNPEVNIAIKRVMPPWILKTATTLEKINHALKGFDEHMVRTYYTYPGIVHAGAEGIFEVALPLTIGTIARIGKSAFTALGEGVPFIDLSAKEAILNYGRFLRDASYLPKNLVPITIGNGVHQTAKPSSFFNLISKFAKNESGSVRLPRCKVQLIRLLEDIGYKIVPGGKGSHIKLRRNNSPMVIITDKKEVPIGTAKKVHKIIKQG